MPDPFFFVRKQLCRVNRAGRGHIWDSLAVFTWIVLRKETLGYCSGLRFLQYISAEINAKQGHTFL